MCNSQGATITLYVAVRLFFWHQVRTYSYKWPRYIQWGGTFDIPTSRLTHDSSNNTGHSVSLIVTCFLSLSSPRFQPRIPHTLSLFHAALRSLLPLLVIIQNTKNRVRRNRRNPTPWEPTNVNPVDHWDIDLEYSTRNLYDVQEGNGQNGNCTYIRERELITSSLKRRGGDDEERESGRA